MPDFLYVYHGGKRPETPEEGQALMARWHAWIDGMGDKSKDKGNPVGMSKTVSKDAVEDNGGANPVSGFSMVTADSIEDAVEMSKGCPHLEHGTIEVAEIIEMM